jgi:hypothetical protein
MLFPMGLINVFLPLMYALMVAQFLYDIDYLLKTDLRLERSKLFKITFLLEILSCLICIIVVPVLFNIFNRLDFIVATYLMLTIFSKTVGINIAAIMWIKKT